MKTRDKAKGRWNEIFTALLGDIKLTHVDHQPCPACGGDDRFRFFPDWEETGGHICNRCGSGDGLNLLVKVFEDYKAAARAVDGVLNESPFQTPRTAEKRPSNKKLKEEKKNKARRMIRSILRARCPIEKVPLVKQYLEERLGMGWEEAITKMGRPNDLFSVPSVVYATKELPHPIRVPALIGIVRNPEGGIVGIHRTFLFEGKDGVIRKERKLTPAPWAGAFSGSAIRLFGEGNQKIGISEGIETAMGVAMLRRQTDYSLWAVISANGIASFDNEGDVIVFADADEACQEAVVKLKERKQRTISVFAPKQKGLDWLDVYRQVG